MKNNKTKEEYENAVNNSYSITQVCRELGISPVGSNHKNVRKKLDEFEIDYSHFTGQAWNTGLNYKPFNRKIPLSDILVENSSYSHTSQIRERLIKEGIKERKCEKCKNTEWLGEPIKLELNHINGVNDDHRLDNLEILCPNCHSITPNFGSKNRISFRRKKQQEEYDVHKNDIPLAIKTIFCKNCNKEFESKSSVKFCSKGCYKEFRSKSIPKLEELLEAFDKHRYFVKVAEHFGVSDNAVRKWCVFYDLISKIKY